MLEQDRAPVQDSEQVPGQIPLKAPNWTTVIGPEPGTGGLMSTTVPVGAVGQVQFYRLRATR